MEYQFSEEAFAESCEAYNYEFLSDGTLCWTIEKTTEHCTRPHCRAKLQVRTTFECKIRQK